MIERAPKPNASNENTPKPKEGEMYFTESRTQATQKEIDALNRIHEKNEAIQKSKLIPEEVKEKRQKKTYKNIDTLEAKHLKKESILPREFKEMSTKRQEHVLSEFPSEFNLGKKNAVDRNKRTRALNARIAKREAVGAKTRGEALIKNEEEFQPQLQRGIEYAKERMIYPTANNDERVGVESIAMQFARDIAQAKNVQNEEHRDHLSPKESQLEVYESAVKAAESRKILRMQQEKYADREFLGKVWHAPGMVMTTLLPGKEGYKSANDYFDMRNAMMVNAIDEWEQPKWMPKGFIKDGEKEVVKSLVRGAGVVRRGALPLTLGVGFAAVFGTTFVVDKLLGFLKKKSTARWGDPLAPIFGALSSKGGGGKKKGKKQN